jgi:hypothetical protein
MASAMEDLAAQICLPAMVRSRYETARSFAGTDFTSRRGQEQRFSVLLRIKGRDDRSE